MIPNMINIQYLLGRDRYGPGHNDTVFIEKFQSRLNFTSSSPPLIIQNLQVYDTQVSALCCWYKRTYNTKTQNKQLLSSLPHLEMDSWCIGWIMEFFFFCILEQTGYLVEIWLTFTVHRASSISFFLLNTFSSMQYISSQFNKCMAWIHTQRMK